MRQRIASPAQILMGIAVFAAVLFACLALIAPACAHAASGTVYSCAIHPSYRNPVTGKIEDAGGESAEVTGQAMVESCIKTEGMLEKTDAGDFYLTVRLSLIDHTSDHKFQVQTWGDSDWTNPRLGVTGTGTDKSGTTNDVTIQVPSQKCVVRVSMYVEDMGRDIICCLYPTDFKKGTPKGFTPTMVTEQQSASSSDDDAANEDDALDDVSQQAEQASAQDSEETEELDTTVVDSAKGLTLSTAALVSDDGAGLSGSTFAIVLGAVLLVLLVAAIVLVLRLRKKTRAGAVRGKDPDDYDYLYK